MRDRAKHPRQLVESPDLKIKQTNDIQKAEDNKNTANENGFDQTISTNYISSQITASKGRRQTQF